MMHTLRNLLVSLGIFVSWAILAFVLWFMAWLLLVPWETTFIPSNIAAWQQTFSNFFTSDVGQMGVFLTLGTLTAVPILRTIIRRWQSAFQVLVLNTGFIFLGYGGLYWAFSLRNSIFSLESASGTALQYNHMQSILPLTLIALCYGFWYWSVTKLGSAEKRKNKLKNSDCAASSIERLTQRSLLVEGQCAEQDLLVRQEVPISLQR